MFSPKRVFNVWKTVFRNWKYTLLVFLIGGVFFLFNVFILNMQNIFSLYSSLGILGTLEIFYSMIVGFSSSVAVSSIYTISIISLMTGVLISMMVYRFNFMKGSGRTGIIASAGLFLGTLVPGCASCGIGLAAILGLSASLASLPFGGLELSFLAIGVLGFSILKVSNDFYKCKVPKTLSKLKNSVHRQEVLKRSRT